MSDDEGVHSFVVEFDHRYGVYILNCLGCEVWFEMDQAEQAAEHSQKNF